MARKSKATKKRNADIEREAISIVRMERQRWETATAFITERVAFKMRQLLRILQKNYYGVFDQPIDPATNQEKVWYPLTFINVEAVIKNIDLDTKDITFQAKNDNGYGVTDLTRAFVKDKLDKMNFGQALDDFERDLAIYGTAVWKTWEENGKLKFTRVNLLNCYLDPTTPSIQQAYRFTERSLMFPEEIQAMNGWINTQGIRKDVPMGVPRIDPMWGNRSGGFSNVKMLDVYECWGKIPKSLITGEKADSNEEVEGHIVVSGLDTPGKERVHLIEGNIKEDSEGNILKPYEECWYTRVPNRWYGLGIAERLLTLQIYANIVFNVRINRSRISQLGIFKYRKGAGITPGMIARLQSNGAIPLQNLEDLQQFVVQEIGATSYKDEDVINSISERLTNAFDVVTGEALPSSTPATNASIQNQNAKSGFSIIKDQLGYFLQRWMDRHALPILAKELDADTVVRLTTDDDKFQQLIETIVTNRAQHALHQHYAQGYLPDPQEFQQAIDIAREQLSKGDLFIKLLDEIVAKELETRVQVTNEEMDVPMTVQNLISLMPAAPQYQQDIVKEIFDLLGLGQPKANQQPMQGPPMPGAPGQAPQGVPGLAQLQQASQAANVPLR
jgi:hypothetical protein